MAAYFTRAVPHSPGFYRGLHNGSTADIEFNVRAKSLPAQYLDDQDVYEVERLVHSRSGKVCCNFFPHGFYNGLMNYRAGLST